MQEGYLFITQKQYDRAISNGIDAYRLETRIKHGWDIEEAINTPLFKKGAGRKFSQEMIALAQRNGISYQTFRQRVKRGWNEVKAATIPTGAYKINLDEVIT